MDYKAIDILKTFGKDELAEFGKFVNSPYFNENSKVVKLFEILCSFHPHFDSKFFNEQNIYKRINPGLLFNKDTFKKIFKGLNIALEKFLAQKNFENKPFDYYDNLFDMLMTKNLQKHGGKCIDNCEEILAKENALNTDYFLFGFKHYTNKANLLITSRTRSNAADAGQVADLISKRGHNVAGFFFKEMIRCFDNLLTFDKNFEINKENYFVWNLFNSIDFNAFFSCMKENAESDFELRVCEVYGAWYSAFSDLDNEKLYFRYRELIMKSDKLFSRDEMRFHITRLMRYCLMKNAKAGNTSKFENELFEIYEVFISKGYYKSSLSEYLSIETFRAVLLLSLKLKRYKWTIEFINKYKSKLPPERRKNLFHYASALYFYHTGKYGESMKHSQKVEFDHFMFKLDLRDLMLMTYYEMGAFENALPLIDTYKHFLSNDKSLSSAERIRHKNFIAIVQKLIEYINNPHIFILMKIEKLIAEEHSNKVWVHEKFEDIKGEATRSA